MLRRDLTTALKAPDAEAPAALRTAIAAIDNAEAIATPSPAPARGHQALMISRYRDILMT
jgi:hypothetical protein